MAKSKKNSAGWVVLSRSLLNSNIWKMDEPHNYKSAWIDLILMVNHEDGEIITRKGEVVKVPRGSTFTSIRKLAERWGWSAGKVLRYLETLTEAQMITQTGTRSGTLLSLVNYSNFQGRRNTDGYTDGNTDGNTGGRRTTMNNNEQQRRTTRARAPVPMDVTMEAVDKWIEKMKREGEA